MGILKCKMCGGDLALVKGSSIAHCEYCGSKQTVPSADNEKKLTLFSRANRLRMACDFDKAAGIYESIVADFPEEAEAYWGLVLCKYGIEYVDDPATGHKIPTCHRSSFESVMDDSNFDQTLENADPEARTIYRNEAKQIEELRTGIIAVSAKEPPYDVFICYKETDSYGNRTEDSVMAQDVYAALTQKGYRVFFSRITLEDKLGVEYEPYIFAALNSAKVMLVFGTDYEYFNAVWVKNEWSRFLKLMAADKEKHLIPCFKNIDAYDMPKDFSRLQAQDMGKIGAMQDLIRGVEKLVPLQSANAQDPAAAKSVATTDTLIKRAFMFVSDGDAHKAAEYIEKVLDIEPENANAYLCRLLVDMGVKQENQLSGSSQRLDRSPAYNKIMQYGSADLRKRIEEYNQAVIRRIGQRNAQMQELEGKKIALVSVIEKSEATIAVAKGKCDAIAAKIKQRSSYLNNLSAEIKRLEDNILSAEKAKQSKYVPIWILIPLLIITVVVSFAVLLIARLSMVNASIFLIPVVLLSLGLLIFSFMREFEPASGGLLFVIIIVIAILLVSLFFGLWVEHGGPFKVLGVLIENVLYAIFGEHTDVFTETVWSVTLFLTNIFQYIVGIIFSIICRLMKHKAKMEYKTLDALIKQKKQEYNARVNGDAELMELNATYEHLKAEYRLTYDACRTEISAANSEYLKTAKAYAIRPENLVPEHFK